LSGTRVLAASRRGAGAVEQREAEVGRSLSRAERSPFGAIATRDRKQYGVDTHTWREESPRGLPSTAPTGVHRSRHRQRDRGLGGGEARVDAETAQAGALGTEAALGDGLAGPNRLTEFANTFDQGSVLRRFAAAADQGATVATVREQTARFLARDDVLATGRGTFTTQRTA
jgi:hypothetical protein